MATDVSICNLALARVGVREFIDSLDGAEAEAQACKVLYAHCRDTLLASFPWPFAQRRASLALVAGAERTNWTYAYALPADYLGGQAITGATRTPSSDARVSFTVEGDATSGRLLLADQEDIEFVYTAAVTDPALFSPLFADALAWLLARELSVTIPNKADYRAQADTMFERQLSRAAAVALGESHEVEPEAQLILARS